MVSAIIGYLRYGAPWLRAKGLDYYKEAKLALMITGYAFRDEKVKAIADTALTIVSGLEELSITSDEKHQAAITELSKELLQEFNLELDEAALDLLIELAVILLPPTNVN